MKKYGYTIISLFLFFVLGGARQVAADAVTDWNANAGEAATAACIAPSTTHSTNRVSTP